VPVEGTEDAARAAPVADGDRASLAEATDGRAPATS